ncbi:alpha-1A adrenergic receptor-like [Megalops cyprinoides]|uniref:alpha-1A adrenergic receptor-like n=1 Tax=Megalops cyprinoides TaxID=118141 RepID=UPI001863F7BA|nr:alpha-1A adrenergic receptor-like [Megalops cyprinoides]
MVPIGVNVTLESPPQDCPNCTQASPPGLNVPKAVVLALVLGVFLVFGVLGNLLVILSVACHRHLRTVTHYFIANLAVADLLLSLAVLPFSATFEILGRWVFGRPLCSAWAALDVLCCTASIMSLCVISVDRCIGVSYPLRYPAIVTKQRGQVALGALWAASLTISAGPLFGWKEPAPEDDTVCRITEEPGYALFSALGSFYVPLAVILAMYCRVYVVARRESRGLREGHKTDRSDPEGVTLRIHRGHSAGAGEDGDEEALRRRAHFSLRLLKLSREKKAAKTLGIVVGCFVLCWLPFFLVLPIGSIFPSYRPSDTVFKITFWLGYFNSCINPIIYPCSSQEFKKAFQNVLRACCLRRKARASPVGHPSSIGGKVCRPRLHSDDRAPSRTPSSHRRWRVFLGPSSDGVGGARGGAEVARVCSKNLLRACCWADDQAPAPGDPRLQSPDPSTAPVVKVHQVSVCEGGESV